MDDLTKHPVIMFMNVVIVIYTILKQTSIASSVCKHLEGIYYHWSWSYTDQFPFTLLKFDTNVVLIIYSNF